MKNKRRSVVLLLMNEDDEILSISRGDNLNDWGLIGGKVEKDETLEYAIMREVEEEADIDIYNPTPVYTCVTEHGSICTTFIAQNRFEDLSEIIFKKSREGQVAWKKPADLCSNSCTYASYNKKLFDFMNIKR